MTAAQIINLALSNTHTKTGQVAAADLILFFNIVRNELGDLIIKEVDENFFFQIWTIDAQDNTTATRENGEYLFPVASSSQAGMLKLLRLAIKGYSTETYFTPCREVDIRNLQEDWLYYMANQAKNDPIYFIADESFFIAPEFKAADLPSTPAGNKQIKAYGIAKLTDLTASAVESAILIPSNFHQTMAVGMEQYIYKARGKKKEAFDAMLDYQNKRQEMIDTLTNRDNSAMCGTLPNDYNLGFGQ